MWLRGFREPVRLQKCRYRIPKSILLHKLCSHRTLWSRILVSPGNVYQYKTAGLADSYRVIMPAINALLQNGPSSERIRILDFGCGSGALSGGLSARGFDVVGVDPSCTGIAVARAEYPAVTFSTDISRDSLIRLGPFDAALCIEVLAHCHRPADELEKLYACVRSGGIVAAVTPYHGYWKNLAMAFTGRLERHLDTSWEGAYLHFFTPSSLADLMRRVGLRNIIIRRLGRIPPFARVMFATGMVIK